MINFIKNKYKIIILIIIISLIIIICNKHYIKAFFNKSDTQSTTNEYSFTEDELNSMKTIIKENKDICYSNKYINEIDVSGKNYDEILNIVNKEIINIKNKRIVITINNNTYSKSIEDFEVDFPDFEKDIINLINSDKNKSIKAQYDIIKNDVPGTEEHLYTKYTSIDKAKVNFWINQIAEKEFIKKSIPKLLRSKKGLKVDKGQDGKILNKNDLADFVFNIINDNNYNSFDIDASEFLINDENNNKEFDIYSNLETLISSFQTSYNSSTGSGKNMEVAADRIDDIIVLPGETISFDELLGPRTTENGFYEGYQFSNGQTVLGVGGGICHTATILYNAILRAGIIPIERYPHSLTVSYVPLGLDAAIATGCKDLVIKNTLEYPIYIRAITKNNICKVKIYSTKDALNGYTYEPYSIVNGKSAKAYLNKLKNNKVIETTYIDSSNYN